MFLLVLAHSGCPGQNPESCKAAVCVCVFYFILHVRTALVKPSPSCSRLSASALARRCLVGVLFPAGKPSCCTAVLFPTPPLGPFPPTFSTHRETNCRLMKCRKRLWTEIPSRQRRGKCLAVTKTRVMKHQAIMLF